MKMTQGMYDDYRNRINLNKFKFKNGHMKEYRICCSRCKRLSKSTKHLNLLGIFVLCENEFIYQRCDCCQNKSVDEHEKNTTEDVDYDEIFNRS